MTVAVITSVYGDHDHLYDPPQQSIECEWICVTDREMQSNVWDIVIEPRPSVSDRLASKFAKCLPREYTDADIIIWVDGAYKFKDGGSVQRLIEWADGEAISQFRHYSRDCVYEEAEVSKKLPKYSFQPVDAQMDQYRKWGHPENYGLFAGGVIVRNFSSTIDDIRLETFGKEWLLHQFRWTDQDQLSEMVVARRTVVKINTLPGNLLDNEAVVWAGHAKGEDR